MTATIHFAELIQDSQELGDAEHMVSRVLCSIEAGGRLWPDLEVLVRQAVGGAYAVDALEVSAPDGYDGPMNYAAFRECVEAYVRALVSSSGLSPGSSIRMRNNRLIRRQECSFD